MGCPLQLSPHEYMIHKSSLCSLIPSQRHIYVYKETDCLIYFLYRFNNVSYLKWKNLLELQIWMKSETRAEWDSNRTRSTVRITFVASNKGVRQICNLWIFMAKLYITIKQASKILGVSPLTLRNWDKNGKMKAHRHPMNNYRVYKVEDLEKVIHEIETNAGLRKSTKEQVKKLIVKHLDTD